MDISNFLYSAFERLSSFASSVINTLNFGSDLPEDIYEQYNYFGSGKSSKEETFRWASQYAKKRFVPAIELLGRCYHLGIGVELNYAKAVKFFKQAAEQGDQKALYYLGLCYEKGLGVAEDCSKAFECFQKAAEQGLPLAQKTLGNCYYNGQGVAIDYAKAVEWYRKAAEQGNTDAQYMLGYCYYNGQGVAIEYAKVVEWYRKAAEQGDTGAQNNLGNCYYNGQGIAIDYAKAVEWYRKAAEQGNAWAQCNLGNCYYNGQGVAKDFFKAVEWYRKAAEQGNANAQFYLGNCYYNGQGVAIDYTKAVEWYRKAVDQGLSEAKKALSELRQRISKEEAEKKAREKAAQEAREEAERKAREKAAKEKEEAERKAREKAAKEKEEAERKAREKAAKEKEEAERKAREEAERAKMEEQKLQEFIHRSENGDAQAACQLGMWFHHGENGITKDIEKAIYWYQKAAMFGNPAALTFLNMVIEEKKSQERSIADAKAKRSKYDSEDDYLAHEKRDADAAYRLAMIHIRRRDNLLNSNDKKPTEAVLNENQIALHYLYLAKEYRDNKHYIDPFIDLLEEYGAHCEKFLNLLETHKNKVFVRIYYKTDRMASSTWHDVALEKEEYIALLNGGEYALRNYVRSNFSLSGSEDIEEVTMKRSRN